MNIRKVLGKTRWKLLAGVAVLAGLVLAMPPFRPTLLGWLRGEPCYAGMPVSYWRYQFRDWRVIGWEALDTVEEERQRGENEKQVGEKFVYVSNPPGRWELEKRKTPRELYAKLRKFLDRSERRYRWWNPTYGGPFCKLAIYDGDPSAIPVLTVLLEDEDVCIRRLAAAALGNIGARGKAAIPALLERANHDSDAFLRGVARAALLDIDKESAEKAGICESFLFWSPQPRRRATIPGCFILDSPRPFLADGKILAWDDLGKTITLRELATGKVLASFQGPADIDWPLAFGPDGKTVASASKDKKTVKLWYLATGKELTTLRGHSDAIESLAFSPDGKTLASGSSDKTVKLWDVAGGQELTSLQGHTGSIACLAFSPDGATLASGGHYYDCRVKLWDVPTGKERATLQHDPTWGAVLCLAFSPDGKTLASGSQDWTVKLIDVATGKERASLVGYDDDAWVDSVSFSPDSQTVASVSLDTIFLWDVATGKNTAKILSKPGGINDAIFTPDGRMLAKGGDGDPTRDRDDHTMTLWEFAAGRSDSWR